MPTVLGLFLAVVLAACGGAASCEQVCKKAEALACPSDPTLAQCTATCNEIQKELGTPACKALDQTWIDCAATKGVFTCRADGYSTLTGCEDADANLAPCLGL
jgi:hypothetical protein